MAAAAQRSAANHWIPTTSEEEELALALALSASLQDSSGNASGGLSPPIAPPGAGSGRPSVLSAPPSASGPACTLRSPSSPSHRTSHQQQPQQPPRALQSQATSQSASGSGSANSSPPKHRAGLKLPLFWSRSSPSLNAQGNASQPTAPPLPAAAGPYAHQTPHASSHQQPQPQPQHANPRPTASSSTNRLLPPRPDLPPAPPPLPQQYGPYCSPHSNASANTAGPSYYPPVPPLNASMYGPLGSGTAAGATATSSSPTRFNSNPPSSQPTAAPKPPFSSVPQHPSHPFGSSGSSSAQQQQPPPAAPPAANTGSSSKPSRDRPGVATGSAGGGYGHGWGHAQASPPRMVLHTNPDLCAGCGTGFGFLGSYLNAMGRRWHPQCFRCAFCSEPLNTGGAASFSIGAADGLPYHADCFKHAHHPVCTVCGQYIAEQPGGRIQYKENPFWRNKYCPSHETEGLPQCCACNRLQKYGEDWVPLEDGRHLCLVCLGTTVTDTRDAQPLYDEVLAFYRDMRMPHIERAPLMLVDAHTLNEYGAREGRGGQFEEGPVFHVRGLTVAHVYSTIPAIMRASLGVNSVSQPLNRGVHCKVTAVLIMYGLPRLLTGSIMAHELMHAYLRMRSVTGLASKVEEGLCQLMACLWLDAQHELLTGDPDQQRLASYLAWQIRNDTSEVYGDGFREAYEAFQVVGLTGLVENVIQTGRLN